MVTAPLKRVIIIIIIIFGEPAVVFIFIRIIAVSSVTYGVRIMFSYRLNVSVKVDEPQPLVCKV
ncbi:hypothetical protein CP97_14713 [Aurantiacibacter atlanticus]|uniref:Uncharacterized protein n=1 Tax=Aurantiacibacter atlanticus TaxID=1648404 RepID=A0A161J497_9SPHN|nr:hypothetical protein CP97_14713 [Aurantiacibacter atlanticus]